MISVFKKRDHLKTFNWYLEKNDIRFFKMPENIAILKKMVIYAFICKSCVCLENSYICI